MRGGVTPGLLFVLCFQHDVAADEHRADRHVAGASRLLGKLERSAQIGFVFSHASMRARRDSNPRSQPSEGCALSSYATGARLTSTSRIGRSARTRDVFEQIELMVDKRPVELPHAVGMSKEIGSRVCEIFAGTIRHVMRDFDFLHLCPIDRMGAEIAWNRRHDFDTSE